MRNNRFATSRVRYGFVVLMVSVFALAHVAAGQETGGSIIGQVKDESGGILPGVTVTATSPALQVPSVVTVTNEQGEYRLSPLPIGLYRVVYDLSGFGGAQQEGVRLTVGFIARLDVVLKVGTLQETVTVSGVSPVVDVTSTSVSTQFTRETLELLPGSRNGIIGVLAQAPGVRGTFDVGGSSQNSQPASRTFGQGAETWYILEGQPVTDMKGGGGAGVYFDFSIVDEARVQTLGADAQFPTRGVQLQMIVKSGGNQFHGTYNAAYTKKSFQANNVDDALRTQGLGEGSPLKDRWDFSADLGGKFVRDKLWFYGAIRRRGFAQRNLGATLPDGSPALTEQTTYYHTEKLSYQMTPGNRLVGFFTYTRKRDDAGATQFVAYENRNEQFTHTRASKVEWQGVRGNLVATLLGGAWGSHTFYPNHADGRVGMRDLVALTSWGSRQGTNQGVRNHRSTGNGSLNWYKSDWLYGNHNLKTGFEYNFYNHSRPQFQRKYNYELAYRSGIPEEIRVNGAPTYPWVEVGYHGLYVQDSWTIGRRVTLNLGTRYSRDNGWVDASCREAADFPGHLFKPASCFPKVQFNIWNAMAPRARASWDLTGVGKTVVKGGWGRFPHMRYADPEVLRADPNRIDVGIYRWRDLNGNLLWEPGETNLDPNGPDFISSSLEANAVPNPNEKQPMSDEFSITFEQELMANVSVRVTGVYSRYKNITRLQNNLRPYSAYNIPVTRPDPGADNRVGTADDPGTSMTYWEYSPQIAGKAFDQFMIINDPNADQDFKSIDLGVFKRFSSGWQFAASYSATKIFNPFNNGLVPGSFNSQIEAANYTPNAEINAIADYVEWQSKVSGAYVFPRGVMVSANFESRSGDPYARQVQFSGGRTITNIVLNAEPIGTQQLPTIHLLDARVEKTFRMGTKELAARLNVYNVLNKNTTTALTMRAGASFLRPTTIMPPRIVEVSASFTF